MALADTLTSTYAGTGTGRTSPDDASGEMHGALSDRPPEDPPRPTDLPARPTIDTGAMGRLVQRFTSIDTGALGRVVAGAGGAASVQVPDAGALLARVQPLLRLVDTARSDDAVALLGRLRAPPAEPALGLTGITASLTSLVGEQRSGAVTSLLASARSLVPVPALDAPAGQIGDALLTARDLVTLLGAMMAVHTGASNLRDGAAMIDQLLQPATADELLRAARAWTASDVASAAVDAVADPEDPEQVAIAERAVRNVTGAIGELTAALTRAMGFGEATLLHADPQRAAAAIVAAADQLRAMETRRIRASAEALGGLLDRVLPSGGEPSLQLEGAWDAATALSGSIVTAIDGLSAEPITRPVQQSLGVVTNALHEINRIFGEISAAIRGAFATVRDAVTAIDLPGIAREVQRFLQPIDDALRELDQFLTTINDTVTVAVGKITDAITAVTGILTTGAGHIKGAFDAIHTVFATLNIPGIIDAARTGVQRVADELHQVQLQPYFDKAIEVMDTSADVISAVPFSLLPDSAKRELDKVVQPIKAIHFKEDVVDVLMHELDVILDRVDTDVLGTIDGLFQDAVKALAKIDPRKITDPMDQAFDEFVGRIKAIDPGAILQPVFAAVDEIRARIAAFDLRAQLAPVDAVFDRILAGLDQVNPSRLLQPIEDQVSGLRQRILDVTHLEAWADKIEEVHHTVDGSLARIDVAGLGPIFDALLDRALGQLPSSNGSVIGSIIASLVESSGLEARPRSFVAVLGWLTGDDGAAEVRGLIGDAAGALDHARTTIRAYDLRAIAAELDVGFRRLRGAVEGKGAATSRLRLRLDPLLAAAAPLDVLGALGDDQARYLAALDVTANAVQAMTAQGLSEITASSGGIRTALAPLATARGRLLAVGRGLGVDLTGRDLAGVLSPIFTALRPSRLLTLVGPVISALRDKVRAILVDGLITPVQAGVAELVALIHALDISVFRLELDALFTQVKHDLDSFRPSVILDPILSDFETVKNHLASTDPLGGLKTILAALVHAVDELSTAFRPSTLMGGLIQTYDEVIVIVQGLNVRTLLDPILSALRDLEAQLGTGLEGSATAFAHLQDALGTLGTGGGGGSVSVGGSA